MMKPLKPCPICDGIGYLIERREGVTLDNPEGFRWIRVPCRKCRGAGFLRE